MAQSSPEFNMALLGNAAEMTRLTVSSMMSNENVRNLFGQPAARENVYAAVMLAVNKRLSGRLRNMPTGQFNKSVLQGKHQSGAGNPNVSA
jgi:hypothetical protein